MQTGRWTIVARAEPMPRRPTEKYERERVHVRCVCGYEHVLWVEDLSTGRSSGCNSRLCAARFLASGDIRQMLEGWVMRATTVLRMSGVPEAEAEAFARERTLATEHAIRDYLHPPSNVHHLEPAAAPRAFQRHA